MSQFNPPPQPDQFGSGWPQQQQYPPQQNYAQPQTYNPQQQNTGYLPWAQVPPSPQDQFATPPQQQMQPWPQQPQYYPPPSPQPPKKNTGKYLVFGSTLLVALVFIVIIAVAIGSNSSDQNVASSTLSEPDYKASTTNIPVATLDKDSNLDKGKDVYFEATIVDFVKDSNGNTVGANVAGVNDALAGDVQVEFPQGMDLSKVNQGDTIAVWGTDDGSFSGANAFGATVQEVAISALYLADITTDYKTA